MRRFLFCWLALTAAVVAGLSLASLHANMVQMPFTTGGGGGGPFVAGNHTAVAGSGTAACSTSATPISTAGASLIVVLVANYDASTGTNVLSDSLTNTWIPDINYDAGASNGSYNMRVWHAYSPIVGASHTFTFTGNYCALFVAAFSGGSTTHALDQTNSNVIGVSATTWVNAAATPTTGSQLVVAGTEFATTAGTINSISAPFTITDTVPYVNSSTSYGGSFAYQIQGTTAGQANPTWTANANQIPATTIATYK
jgi:hypothetical protein